MCGICGTTGQNTQTTTRMLQTILHRGPDDTGYFSDHGISLGHARLSIIDIDAGTQPMSYANGRYVVVYNGEIYNHVSVRTTLEDRGHVLQTNSDTEILLAAYAEWGRGCLHRLRGMFAFALWDTVDQSLWLVRDRLGIKPLYYCISGQNIAFASETKALLASMPQQPAVDVVALHQVMNYRYVRGERTMWKGIRRLLPGHSMYWRDGHPQLEQYWAPPPPNDGPPPTTQELSEILENAVAEHLVSDVPVAAFLSGGLDSTAISSWARSHLASPMKSFCLEFGTHHDETTHAKMASDKLGLEFHSVQMDPTAFQNLEKVIWHLDEPIGDAIAVATYILASEASQHSKVVLTGEGADEIFGGYIHHRAIRTADLLNSAGMGQIISRMSHLVKLIPSNVLSKGFPYPGVIGDAGKTRIQDLVGSMATTDTLYRNLTQIFNHRELSHLYTDQFMAEISDSEKFEDERMRDHCKQYGSGLSAAIRMDLTEWLPNYTLHRLDRLLMAHGLEGRVPFLDHRVVEAALRIPLNRLLTPFQEKKELRKCAPGNIRQWAARPKQAFSVPLDDRGFALAATSQIKQLIASAIDANRGYLSQDALRYYLDFSPGDLLTSKQVLSVVMTEVWHQVFVDRPIGRACE